MAERAKIFNLGDLCKFLHLDTSQTARFMTSTLQRVPSVFRAAGLGGVVCVCYPPVVVCFLCPLTLGWTTYFVTGDGSIRPLANAVTTRLG